MPRQSKRPFLVAPLLACALLASAAHAGEPTEQLRAGINGVLEVLRNPDIKGPLQKAERRRRIRKIIHQYFDFREMSMRSLARRWKKRTEAERSEFTRLFSHLMERNYASKLESYTDERILFVKEVSDEEFARVDTRVLRKDGQPVDIVYRMHRVSGGWRVYDVSVEGISLLKNYRDQFRSIIRRTSFANLVRILRAKRDEG